MAGRSRMIRVASAVVCAVLLVGWAQAAQAATSARAVPLSRALDLLQSGKADSAVLTGPEQGDPTLTVVMDDRRLATRLPYTALVEEAVSAAREGGVPLRLAAPPRDSTAAPAAPSIDGGGPDIAALFRDWAPMVLLAALVLVAAVALRKVGGARFSHQTRPATSSTRFDEVAGIDEIRDEVSEIADFLRAPSRYEQLGATLPRGVILHGAPGTGKTLLARAVAGEAGVPFFSASGSEFVEVYSGLGSRRIRALFEAARKAAPAVVYIDEIDAVGGKRTGHASSGEREQTLDQLLSEMDGFRTDPGRPVVVLASTNRLDELDPALVRSGRFDRKIAVSLPGRAAREAILDVHTRRRPLAGDARLGDVAAYTAGLAGADLAALCNEASFEAARAGRQTIDAADFRRALMRLAAGPERRQRILTEEERSLVAYHEMGHAIVGHLTPGADPVERVTVIPQGQALGVTIALPEEDRFLVTRTDGLGRLAMMMGGRAAEELVFGEMTSGAADDLARATALARRMVAELGMGGRTTEESVAPPPPGGALGEERVEREARGLLEEAYGRARALLEANRARLDEAAALLLEREALERSEIEALLGPRPEGRRLRALSA